MSNNLPVILEKPEQGHFPAVVETEVAYLTQARNLIKDGYPAHALLDIWNAAVHNLRRRIEAYGVELFLSSIKDEAGRKKYDSDGETLNERWSGVDEYILIVGATRLGIINKKAGKALEMINWMRNHASPAHVSDSRVELEDVFGLALILQKNLFEMEMPDPGHSPSGLFDPIKNHHLDEERLEILRDQIRAFRQADIRITFGFMLDLICKGEEPSFSNAKELFKDVWDKANEDLRKSAGQRYYSLTVEPESDDSEDNGARIRLLETLLDCDGIKYIPDAARAILYRHAVKPLARAKDTQYGWAAEEKAAKSLAQFGPHVPSIAFEDVYQEILAVWCGNYWGRSSAHVYLKPFIDSLNSTQLMKLARWFQSNDRVRDELFQIKPKKRAIEFLEKLKNRLTIQANKDEIDTIIDEVQKL